MNGDKLNVQFVSCICGEIIATQSIESKEESLPTFKSFRDRLYGDTILVCDDYNGLKSSLIWQFSAERFLKIKDFFTLSAFLNLAPTDRQTLYAMVSDAEHFPETTKKYLEMLDLMELRDEKVRLRSKYDLKSEADVIQEQILKIQHDLFGKTSVEKVSKEKTNEEIVIEVDKQSNAIEIRGSSDRVSTSNPTVSRSLTNDAIARISTEQSIKTDLKTNSLKECESTSNLRVPLPYGESDIHPDIIDNYYIEKVYKDESASRSIKSDTSEETVNSDKEIIFIKATDSSFADTSHSDTKSFSTTESFGVDREIEIFIKEFLNDILGIVVKGLLSREDIELVSKEDSIQDSTESKPSVNEQLDAILEERSVASHEREILLFALRKMPIGKCYTADICSGYSIIDCLKKAAMKGRIISCSSHANIYYLEADSETQKHQQHHPKTEESNLESLFISPAGREMLKYKSTSKIKPHKINSNTEFFTNKTPSMKQSLACTTQRSISTHPIESPSSCTSPSLQESGRSSLDLYEEAAAILGLTCAQTDNCRCIECQCHYFDFEESEMSFPTAIEVNNSSLINETDSTLSSADSVCSIQ